MSKTFKRLSAQQMRNVVDASGQLNWDEREPFFQRVAHQLKDCPERGDGPVGEAIRNALASAMKKNKPGGG